MIFENISMALAAIRANKTRSLLTMLGMIIGIAAVIAIVSLGDTLRDVFAKEYESVGLGLCQSYIIGEDDYYTEREMYSLDDKEAIQEAMGDDLAYIGVAESGRADFKVGRKTEKAYYQGLAENPTAYQKIDVIAGRLFSDADLREGRPYIVVEDVFAQKLFGRTDVVGETVRMSYNNELLELTIIGVWQNHASALMRLLGGVNDMGTNYLPETLITGPDDIFWSLTMVTADGTDYEAFHDKFVNFIARRKGVLPENVQMASAQEEMAQMNSILSKLSLVVGAIAAISLVVGGIGIMNIMLVSVTERTREIGVRKALGAQTSDVMFQFLIESAAISAGGGIIGTALGIGVVGIGAALVGMSVVVNPGTVLLAVGFSALVGIFFGLYPASKAAKADPIEALRYE